MRHVLALAALAGIVCALLTGCTRSASGGPSGSPSVTETTVTRTRPAPTSSAPPVSSAAPTYTPAPATTVPGLAPGHPLPAGEVDGTCPYIATQTAADIEGDRIYRTTIIKSLTPVGCRFYFWCCDYEAIADIIPTTFGSAVEAHNAMVLTGQAGGGLIGVPNLIPGVDAVLYQTKFYGPDGDRDWACTFAKGKVMVTVHTQQNDVSFNAKNFAATIAPKF